MWIMAGFDRGLLTVRRRSSAALASETRVEPAMRLDDRGGPQSS